MARPPRHVCPRPVSRRFSGSQAAGDSQVTFSVPVLSPPLLYNRSQEAGTMSRPGSEEAVMHHATKDATPDKTPGRRGRHASAMPAMSVMAAAVAVLAAGCGLVPAISTSTAATGPAAHRADVAFAHCMQHHGVPNFPTPGPDESFHISGHLHGTPHGTPHGPRTRALEACRHLLPPGSITTNSPNAP